MLSMNVTCLGSWQINERCIPTKLLFRSSGVGSVKYQQQAYVDAYLPHVSFCQQYLYTCKKLIPVAWNQKMCTNHITAVRRGSEVNWPCLPLVSASCVRGEPGGSNIYDSASSVPPHILWGFLQTERGNRRKDPLTFAFSLSHFQIS